MPQSLIAKLARLDRFGQLLENFALVTLLSSMMLLAVGQIILREVFNTGLAWAPELLKLMVLWLAMIAALAATRDDRHIRIDAISHLLPESAIRVSRVVVDTFAAVVCAVIAWQSYRYLQIEIEYQDEVLIDTPAWIAHVIIPVAFTLTAYRFVVSALRKALRGESIEERGAVS